MNRLMLIEMEFVLNIPCRGSFLACLETSLGSHNNYLRLDAWVQVSKKPYTEQGACQHSVLSKGSLFHSILDIIPFVWILAKVDALCINRDHQFMQIDHQAKGLLPKNRNYHQSV